jgi:hypothetical protein
MNSILESSLSLEKWNEPFMYNEWTSREESFVKYQVLGKRLETKCNKCNKSMSFHNLYFLHPEDHKHYFILQKCCKLCKGMTIPTDENIPYLKKQIAKEIFADKVYPEFEKKWKKKDQQMISQKKQKVKVVDIFNPSNPEITYSPKMCCVFQ